MFYVCEKDTGNYGVHSYEQTPRAAQAEAARLYGLSRVSIAWDVRQIPFDFTQEQWMKRDPRWTEFPHGPNGFVCEV